MGFPLDSLLHPDLKFATCDLVNYYKQLIYFINKYGLLPVEGLTTLSKCSFCEQPVVRTSNCFWCLKCFCSWYDCSYCIWSPGWDDIVIKDSKIKHLRSWTELELE